jgi:chemotaxis protein histidine kinase CheA/ActR/RegA family two-component response regulator
MDAAQQKRILGYFLQETQEHLAILHEAVTAMAQPLEDADAVSSWFRAAHSIKGGAAMLGLDALQQMALRLENCLKILRDQGVERRVQLSPEMVDRFRQGVAALEGLVHHLEQEGDIPFEMGQRAVLDQEPNFIQLEALLQILVQGEAVTAAWDREVTAAEVVPEMAMQPDLGAVDMQASEELDLVQLFESLDAEAAVAEAGSQEAAVPMANAVQELASLAELFSLEPEAEPAVASEEGVSSAAMQASEDLADLADLFTLREVEASTQDVGSLEVVDAGATAATTESEPSLELGEMPPFDSGAESGGDAGDLSFAANFEAVDTGESLENLEPLAAELSLELDEEVPDLGAELGEMPLFDSGAESGSDAGDLSFAANFEAVDTGESLENLEPLAAELSLELDEEVPDLGAELGEMPPFDSGAESGSDAGDLSFAANFEAVDTGESLENLEPLAGELSLELGEEVPDLGAELGEIPLFDSSAESGSDAGDLSFAANFEAVDTGESLENLEPLAAELSLELDEEVPDLGAESGGTWDVDEVHAETEDRGELSLDDVPEIPDELSSSSSGLVGDIGVDLEAALAAFASPASAEPAIDQTDADPWAETNWESLEQEIGASEDVPTPEAELEESGQPVDTELTDLDLEDVPDLELSDVTGDLDLGDLELPDLSEDLSTLEEVLSTENLDDIAKTLGIETAASEAAPQPKVQETEPRSSASASAPVMEQTMRVPIRQLDNLSNLIGELVVSRNTLSEDQNQLRQFLENLLHQAHQLNDLSQRMQDLYERSLLEGALNASRGSGLRSVLGAGEGSAQHSTGAEFDALEMDRFTGFHTLSQEIAERVLRVREAAQDIGFMVEAFDEVVRSFQRITQGLQEGINSARMEPFSRVTDRLPRAVRNVALKCGKQVKLEIEGRETLVDKMILEKLTDPMTHLVNNAIVHGISSPEQRQAAGRPPVGTITIRAAYQGNQTVITVSDDGVGINPDRVKAKALERGLITPEQAATMSKQDIYQLLFMPGFSTKDQADEFAGRGVGLDVVRQNLAEIRGTVVVDSELGKGTTFTIRLPLTLSISKSLPCVVSHARVAFPMDGVADVPADVTPEMIQTGEDGKLTLNWQGKRIPLRPLSELLRYGRLIGRGNIYGATGAQEGMSVVVVHSLGRHVAFQVDQVLSEQEVVIKQLTGPVKKPLGIAGATILGDGRIMMIADILELVDLALGYTPPPSAPLWQGMAPVEPETTDEPTVLIVDDSIVVREMLSMTFSNKGYRVEQARDGQEAWEKLRDGLPCDLMFCDIEMPRMDGLELLSKVRRDANLKGLPIAMLTSRGAERHRQMAIQLGANAYFTKPYLEETLLDAARRLLRGENLVSPNR